MLIAEFKPVLRPGHRSLFTVRLRDCDTQIVLVIVDGSRTPRDLRDPSLRSG
jgi:hypothetical protein